ncbi:unnamed protein product [Rotaria sp. Silwood2]|nr:unnamed protein product [Rotaria sp. Silwood2]CAF3440164.1 unnamed protein product [Rotaria sp. Silwood2]CAF4341341.1 unnamed protein product [Rotaria sp. Silwood2]CAF4400346.1 unnamed protein product [Rotaria sp. Silwood2]
MMLFNIILTFIILISSSLTTLIAFTLLFILVIHLSQKKDVALLLATNTYAAMIAFSLIFLSQALIALKADLYGIDKKLIGCQVLGFLTYETFGCLYMTFVLQAFYRLTRVVYTKYKFLQAFSFNLICILLQWVICFLLILPSYFWPGPLYSFYESDYYCGIRYEKILGLSYTIINIFFVPLVHLMIIYARLLHFIRYQASQLSQERQRRRAHRDLIVIRRILFTVIALTLPGIPNVVFAIMTNIDFRFSGSYYMYRIQFLGPAVTVFILSIAIIFITPQIKQILMKLKLCNSQVAPMILQIRELEHPSVLLPMPIQI